MRDIANNISVSQAIAPAVLTATVTGDAIDLVGFNSAAIVINTGAIAGAGDFTATLEESDDGATGWTTVPADRLVGAFPDTLEADAVVKVGYIGWRRFVRVVLTKNGGTSIAAGATVLKGHPAQAPVA